MEETWLSTIRIKISSIKSGVLREATGKMGSEPTMEAGDRGVIKREEAQAGEQLWQRDWKRPAHSAAGSRDYLLALGASGMKRRGRFWVKAWHGHGSGCPSSAQPNQICSQTSELLLSNHFGMR